MVQRMKVAVALACLRNKPAGMSGRQYAQMMCDNFQRSQLVWQDRYKTAEAEILHLKQQLILQQHSCHVLVDVDQNTESTNFGSGSQSIFPTPPASCSQIGTHGHMTTGQPQTSSPRESLTQHTAFLHHMVNIQTASRITDHEHCITKLSLERSLDCIAQYLGQDGEGIPLNVETRCVDSICKLTEIIEPEIKAVVIDKVQELAQMAMNNILHKGLGKQRSARLINLLTHLGSCEQLSPSLLHILVNQLVTFSDHLRKVIDNKETIQPAYFCSMYHVFQITDNILQHVTIGNTSVLEGVKDELQCKLDDCLLHVTDQFPVFAHAVWRISTRLSLMSSVS